MQNEITQSIPLLKPDGSLTAAGWARQPFWQYDRTQVKAPWYRKKEWDYYSVLSDDMQTGITFTISDLGYAGLLVVCWLDFKYRRFYQTETLTLLPMGKLGLDQNSESSCVKFSSKDLSVNYQSSRGARTLDFSVPNIKIDNHVGLSGQLVLSENPQYDSLNIATSWHNKPKAFYYNRKINTMLAQGQVSVGGIKYEFTHDNCLAGLDWGRGNWTYKNRWFWASANGHVNGKLLGLNLGYGFSDRSSASENVVFYDGQAHKIEDIKFHFNEDDYLQEWQTSSSDDRLQLKFTPILDRSSNSNMLIIKSNQHQVFGYFNGSVVLDDGQHILIDNVLGFAEDVFNCF
jgi:hypothetical protein